jgi:hypothetical protein
MRYQQLPVPLLLSLALLSLVIAWAGCAAPVVHYTIEIRKPAAERNISSEIIIYEQDVPAQAYETLAHIRTDMWITTDGEYVSGDGDDIREAAKQEAIRIARELGGDAVILSYHYVGSVSCIAPIEGFGEIRGAVVRFIMN